MTTSSVYVAPDGALAYTAPHSASVPEGAVTTGWRRKISAAGGAPTILWLQTKDYSPPITACPAAGESGVYQIFLKLNMTAPYNSSCIGFEFRTYRAGGGVAWEY